MAPPVSVEEIGNLDAVLMAQQHHYDNLDIRGRELLPKAGRVLTTPDAANVLGDNAEGLETWQTVDLINEDGQMKWITKMLAVHWTDVPPRRTVI